MYLIMNDITKVELLKIILVNKLVLITNCCLSDTILTIATTTITGWAKKNLPGRIQRG